MSAGGPPTLSRVSHNSAETWIGNYPFDKQGPQSTLPGLPA